MDCFIGGAGTGGTINGVGRYLKEKNADCHVVCVEPTESRVLVGEEPEMHGVVGIGAGLKLPLLEELAPGQYHNTNPPPNWHLLTRGGLPVVVLCPSNTVGGTMQLIRVFFLCI